MDRSDRLFWIINIAFIFLRLLVAGLLPLSADEAYYWTWSKELSLSYFDHPPMVAWWIALSTRLFGFGSLSVRFFAPLAMAVLAWMLYRYARRQTGKESALRLSLALQLMPFTNLGGVILTPDTPLLLFWTIAMLAFFTIYRSGKFSGWLKVGLALGMGLLSKYTMVLFPLSVWLAKNSRIKKISFEGPITAAALALILFLPVLIWNGQQGFASFAFQWGHGSSVSGNPLTNLGSFLLAQIMLFSPIYFYRMLYAFMRIHRSGVPDIHAAFAWFPLAFFIPFATMGHAEAGWAAVAYPAGLILATREMEGARRNRFASLHAGGMVAAIVSVAVYLWAFGFFGQNPVLAPFADMRREVEKMESLLPARALDLPVFADNYRTASLYAAATAESEKLPRVIKAAGDRSSHYDYLPPLSMDKGLLWVAVAEGQRLPKLSPGHKMDCRWASERWPIQYKRGRYAFMLCLPDRRPQYE